MAKQITSWQAEDGSLHNTECEAATRDVELLVEKSPLAENSPYAKKLVAWLCDNAGTIRATLEAHERACPRAEVSEDAALGSAEKGPVESGRGITEQASMGDLVGHVASCGARASGFFRHCDCGALSTGQVEEYRRLSDAAFPKTPR